MNNIMLDLETLGNGSDAAIIAIGAVKFDPATGEMGDIFHELIDPESCTAAGLKIDASTFMWWMKQSAEARAVFDDKDKFLPLAQVLYKFWDFVGDTKRALVWGNGANFDNVILANAYKAAGQEQPWPYWGDRCYRTIAALRKDIKRVRVGTHHNALNDATTQAQHLMEILRSL